MKTIKTVTQKQAFIPEPAFRKPSWILVVGWPKVSLVIQVNPGGCPSCIEGTKVTLLVGERNTEHSKVGTVFSIFLVWSPLSSCPCYSQLLLSLSHRLATAHNTGIQGIHAQKLSLNETADCMWRLKLLKQRENKIKQKKNNSQK